MPINRGASRSAARPRRPSVLPSPSASTLPFPGARFRVGRFGSVSVCHLVMILRSLDRRACISLNSLVLTTYSGFGHQDLLDLVLRGLDAVIGRRMAWRRSWPACRASSFPATGSFRRSRRTRSDRSRTYRGTAGRGNRLRVSMPLRELQEAQRDRDARRPAGSHTRSSRP